MRLSQEDRDLAVSVASRSAVSSGVLTLRANGKPLAAPDTDALLAKAVARERVELELDVLAYEQGQRDSDGNRLHNRNHVRFRDGALMKLGRTGKGTPFLRDHRQTDSSARGGTVIESWTEKVDDEGHYRLRQTVRLSEPAAVERALRGLMSAVSIGWRPTGPVLCTACKTEIFEDCWHFPGDVADDGAVVEWEFTEAELAETSEVPVPGVQTAEIDGIRAALAATAPINRGAAPRQGDDMSNLATIATHLGLAATAGESEVSAAVAATLTERNALREQLAGAQRRVAEVTAQLGVHEAAAALQAENAFIAEAIAAGKVTLGAHEQSVRAYFRTSPEGARTLMAAAPRITPLGVPPAGGAAPPSSPPVPLTVLEGGGPRQLLAEQGVDYETAKRATRMFLGNSDPDKALQLYADSQRKEA